MSVSLVHINKKEAFRYLGYGTNEPDSRILSIADECEKLLLDIIEPKYVYKYFDLQMTESITLENTELTLTGASVLSHLSGCCGAVLFAATLSEGADRLIRKYSVGHMTESLIMDALSNAAIEQVCDMVEDRIKERFPDKYFTWRFSPGYGDLPLEIQRDFLKVLDAEKRIGVNITDGGLMTPCKSVTAIIGVSEHILENKRRGCSTCRMKDRCQFRIKGEHCGF